MSQTTTILTEATPLLSRINALKSPIAKGLLRNLYDAWSEAIEIPNSLLPARLHGRTGRTAKEILHPEPTEEDIKRQEAEDRQIEKDLRVEEYRKDDDNGMEIRYHVDEERLIRNQVTFANLIGLEFDE